MDSALHPVELRVLGALIEKESTTPEYYPMTLNSLMAACNQKTNRWPVTEYAEDDIAQGIDLLKTRGYAASISGSGRVVKFAQRFTEKLNLGRRETAIVCVLMLRGPQTAGEIKGRTERVYAFADLDETETVLQKMMDRSEGALVRKLPHTPGTKEPRYAQTLGGAVELSVGPVSPVPGGGISDRVSALESEVGRLREELAELRRRLDEVLN
ncbi:MAG: YceH family protein [Acidobacteriota bacterium]|nr:YceH family protein [Acidobacteriota bacterium]